MGFGEIAAWYPGMKDPIAEIKEVVYRPSTATDTIRVGDLVCYNWDATSDYKEATSNPSSDGSTYAEGSQNYTGRLLIVEKPATANLQFFAGVVAQLGPDAGADGDRIQIYVPNGAVVPVMCDQYCTNGRTIVAVRNGAYEGSYPSSAARPIGIALETIDRSSADGLCWVKVDPSMFIWQYHASAINIDDEITSNDCIVNKLYYTTAQTGGRFEAFEIIAVLAGSSISQTGYGTCLYCEQDIAVAVAGQTPCAGFWTNLTGGTQTEPIFGLQVGIYESGATLTSSNIIAILTLTSQFAENPQANSHCWIHLENNGTYPPDCLIRAGAIADLGAAALSGDVTFSTSGIKIPIYISGSSTTYYIPAQPSI